MNIFGIIRNAANLLTDKYVDEDLKQPNLSVRGNLVVEQVLASGAAIPVPTDTDDGIIAVDQVLPLIIAQNYVYEPSSNAWRRQRALPDNADAQAESGLGIPVTVNHPYIYNGVSYDRQRSGVDNADAQAALGGGTAAVVSRLQGWNGVTFDRFRVASAQVQSSFSAHVGIGAVALAGNWSIQSDPAVNTQATITRAAGGGGIRHICTSIHATLSAGATASGIVKVYLRDGATGAGAILWSGSLKVPVESTANISISGLSIVGSVNTAMTLEFSAAGGATTQENVSLTGYSV